MIFCKKQDIAFYAGFCQNLDTAIAFVQKTDLTALPFGRNEIDEDRVFLNHFEYDTKDASELLYESHVEYADVHLLIAGHERILCAMDTELTEVERDLSADYIGLQGKETSEYHMTTEDVLIVFPHEAHKVKCTNGEASHVNKAVIKVQIAGV